MVVKSFALLPNTENGRNRRTNGITQTTETSLGFEGLFIWSEYIFQERGKDRGRLDISRNSMSPSGGYARRSTRRAGSEASDGSDPFLTDMAKGNVWEPRLLGLTSTLTTPGRIQMSCCLQPERLG